MPTYFEIIKSENYEAIRKIFEDNRPAYMTGLNGYTFEQAKDEYIVDSHRVMINDSDNRPDKTIFRPVISDSTGETLIDTATGNAKVQRATSKVNRVPLPVPEIIVNRRVGFMLGNPIKYDVVFNDKNPKEQTLVDYVYEIEDSSKISYKNKEIARRMMSEMACAELWYLTELKEEGFWNYISSRFGFSKPKYLLKMKVLSPMLGDGLYPLFDGYGDLIAFARSYKLKEDQKEVDCFDVYTLEMTYKFSNRDTAWKLDETSVGGGKIPNLAQKIPLVYHQQEKPEWANVQKMIERLEKLLSNHGDMNDYFGEPILAIFGQLIQAVNKGESGKILQLAENAKASFLALDSPPESVKMEIENLEKFIFALSQTPNISFSEMKSLGDLSGVALELMFLDAHLAARAKEEVFGVGIQRRVNLIKAFIGNILDVSLAEASQTVKMKPVFTPYMPKNMKELIETMSQSVASGIISTTTATEKLENEGYISDASKEQERLQQEADLIAKRNNQIGLNFQ